MVILKNPGYWWICSWNYSKHVYYCFMYEFYRRTTTAELHWHMLFIYKQSRRSGTAIWATSSYGSIDRNYHLQKSSALTKWITPFERAGFPCTVVLVSSSKVEARIRNSSKYPTPFVITLNSSILFTMWGCGLKWNLHGCRSHNHKCDPWKVMYLMYW